MITIWTIMALDGHMVTKTIFIVSTLHNAEMASLPQIHNCSGMSEYNSEKEDHYLDHHVS